MEGIDWYYIALTVIALGAVLFLGGYYWKLKKEITEFVDVIQLALADNKIAKEELDTIIKEGKDVSATLKELTFSVLGLIRK